VALVREIEWEACLLEPRRDPELEKRIRKQSGRVPGAVAYFSGCPWAPGEIAALSRSLLTQVHVDPDIADLAGLVVSQDNSCRFCFAAQRTLMQILGVPRARIARLEQDFLTAELEPRQRAALNFVRRVSRSNPLPSEADKKPLRDAGFSEPAIKELAAIAAVTVFFNRLSTLPALPPQRMEELPDRWYVRLVRPAIAVWLKRLHGRVGPEPLRPEEKAGPFSYVVVALDGLPAAGSLRRALDAMWSSPVLSARAKALVFAVVARTLGCRRAEEEAVALAGRDLARDDIDQILSHLASPALDPIEAVVVPLARETVWYQAAQIQRRAREVQEALSAPQFLELIVVAALANAVCRLGIVADGG
jgi:alkylhydroperoxidase family enzyme